MDIQRPIFWYQGLFLQPQHFQQLDLSCRALLAPFHDHMQPHFWGVGRMEIQKAALGVRTFSITEGSFLFPDGTYVALSDNAVVETRPFEAAWVEGGRPFKVFLGLRKWSNTDANTTVREKPGSPADVTTRFMTGLDPEEVRDLHSAGPSGQVRKMNYALRIFWETELDQLGEYVVIPVAQLERSGDEVLLSANYIPPCLAVSASETLLKLVKEVRDQISARGRQLEEMKRQRGIQTAEFGSRDMVYLLALRSLNRYVPLLYHFTEAGQVHPWQVYGVLRQLVGELSSFSEKVNVLGEAGNGSRAMAYDHSNLWDSFSRAQSLVAQLLDEITAGPEYVCRLVFDGTYYAAELKPAVFEGRNRFYLVLRTDEDPKFVIQSVTTVAKLSSRENLPLLIARALPGLGLEHLPVPPQELPRRAHTVYFEIDVHADMWGMVEKGHNIALYWDAAPEDLEVELMVVGRS